MPRDSRRPRHGCGPKTRIPEILHGQEAELLESWLREQSRSESFRADLIKPEELRRQSADFLRLFLAAIKAGNPDDIKKPAGGESREMIAEVSSMRLLHGFTPQHPAP